ncbi:MAG: hypothetical protein V3S72_06245 [Desulfobacterales bacterium]
MVKTICYKKYKVKLPDLKDWVCGKQTGHGATYAGHALACAAALATIFKGC